MKDSPPPYSPPSSIELIQQLGLTLHDEGGYYCPCYQCEELVDTPGLPRSTYSTIYYMLTGDNPIGHLHVNRSDILHFFHAGWPLTYLLVSPDGKLERRILGPDLQAGHELQLLVRAGTWKATLLEQGSYGLLSEVVVPAFDVRKREMASANRVKSLFPHLWQELARFVLASKEEQPYSQGSPSSDFQ